jgi:UDP-glucose 4-epimerase
MTGAPFHRAQRFDVAAIVAEPELLVGRQPRLEGTAAVLDGAERAIDRIEARRALGVSTRGRFVIAKAAVADEQRAGGVAHGVFDVSISIDSAGSEAHISVVSSSRERLRVGITGLDSFVGLHLAERLLDSAEPPEVVGFDLRVPRRLEDRVRFHRIDLTDPGADAALAEAFEKERCDTVLHAAFFAVRPSDSAYAHEVEVIGSLHVMNAVAAAGVRRLVVMSSAEVYGPSPTNPGYLRESHPLRARAESHGASDRAEVDRLLGLFAARHPRIAVTVLRPCWVVGPTIKTRAVRHFEEASVTTLMGYDPLVQFLHEADLLRAVELALRSDHSAVYNLAGSEPLPLSTLLRLANKSRRALPHPLFYRLGHLPELWSAGDPPAGFYDYLRFSWLVDTTRATEDLGFVPEYTTKEAWLSLVVDRRMRSYR